MKTVFVTDEHLGNDATEADARRMVELLKERGYDARLGNGKEGCEAVPDEEWNECLDQIFQENYSA